MKVLKFGGTSVGSLESLKAVLQIVADYQQNNEPVAVVVSAMGGVTNKLLDMGAQAAGGDGAYTEALTAIEARHLEVVREFVPVKEQSRVIAELKRMLNDLEDLLRGVFLLRELSVRTNDLLTSFGERLSAYQISECLKAKEVAAAMLDARKVVRTDGQFGKAIVDFEHTNEAILKHFAGTGGAVQIITGFIGSTVNGETTTLGRGGSDYTAAIFGAALDSMEVEIWTDVDGVMTADPRAVGDAMSIGSLSYQEAMELSHFGAKVIYPPTLQPLFARDIPIRIRNTFNRTFAGTLICKEAEPQQYPVRGISSVKEVALVNLTGSGMVGVPGVAHRLFEALANRQVNVILITQASSEHSICFAVAPADAADACKAIEDAFALERLNGKIDAPVVENDLSIVAVIGENMKEATGVSGKLYTVLGKNGINIKAIAQGSSEFNISTVISRKDLAKALNVVHESFFLSDIRRVHLFLVGTGLIGSTLLKQVNAQRAYLLETMQLQIEVVGIARSKRMLFNEKGIGLEDWRTQLEEEGDAMDLGAFVDRMAGMNLSNSIFVDCTSSEQVIGHYEAILGAAVSIVTPNKLANTGPQERYVLLKQLAKRKGVQFLYETNVGAGLPVITTMRDLMLSGDTVLKIEGVLSGTLSYIFNAYDGNKSFSQVVREAKELGYTEPDPREDLNGSDVARKILILAREAGHELEPEDVKVENILPKPVQQASTVEEFFHELEQADGHFEDLRQAALVEGRILRFMATLDDGKVNVGLSAVDNDHPFFALDGADNIVSFTTKRYQERPLVVKGPGAGAEVTAAGVFAEIITAGAYLFAANA